MIAHELAHIRNRDMLLQTVTATVAGAISYLGNMALWGAMLGGGRGSDEGSPAGGRVRALRELHDRWSMNQLPND